MKILYNKTYSKTIKNTIVKAHDIIILRLRDTCACSITLKGAHIEETSELFFMKKCFWNQINFIENVDMIQIWVALDKPMGDEFFKNLFKSMVIRSHLSGIKYDLNDPEKLYLFINILINEFWDLWYNQLLFNKEQFFSYYKKHYEKIDPIYKISYVDFINNINPLHDYNNKNTYWLTHCEKHKPNVIFIPLFLKVIRYIPD